jgi:hypothetical protein
MREMIHTREMIHMEEMTNTALDPKFQLSRPQDSALDG